MDSFRRVPQRFRMNWELLSFDWTRARAFLATAETGSLSAAARVLGLTQPTVGRQVSGLEAELGAVLFERVGTRLVLTPGGTDLLEHVRAMAEAARRVALTASGRAEAIVGPVRISAGEMVAAHLLPPVLRRLSAEHPGLVLSVLATGRLSDLRLHEADIALRNVRPNHDELIAQRLPDVFATLYAATTYLDARPAKRRAEPQDLSEVEFVGFDDQAGMAEAMSRFGLSVAPAQFRLLTEAHPVQWAWVRQGLGAGLMLCSVGDADPSVARFVPDAPPIPVPMWLVAHREVHTSRRVRTVFDALADALGPSPDPANLA